MKYVTTCIMFVSALVSSHSSFASNEGVYMIGGVSTFKYSGLKQSPTERKIQSLGTGSYTTEDKSINMEVGLGYCPNQYFCVDVVVIPRVKIGTQTHISSFNGKTINLNGTEISTGNLPVNINLSREGEVSATRFSVSGEYPIANKVSVIGRAGIYVWKAKVVNKISFDNSGIYLGFNETDSGKDPMASIGFSFKFNDRTDVILDFMHIKNVAMNSLYIRHSW